MQSYRFETGGYRQLIFTAACGVDGPGLVRITDGNGVKVFEKEYAGALPRPSSVELGADGAYELWTESVVIHFMYLSESPDLLDRGVTYLEISEGRLHRYAKENIGDFYIQPFRNQYHFSAFKNWMNDPNGLCYINGHYHLFYQMNPNGLTWDLMHWGHAVSTDLLHWTHLPIALYPQDEFYAENANTANARQIKEYALWCKNIAQSFSGSTDSILGGAYTGSAVVDADRIRLYFTRSIGPLKKGEKTSEKQSIAYLYDELHVTGEKTIIGARPEGKNDPTFRDPKVVNIAGEEYMLIATTVDRVCSVMMYKRIDDERWDYMGVVMRDDVACNTFECVNYVQSPEDPWHGALLCGLQAPKDPYGRTCLTYCYIGRFVQPDRFEVESRTLYDFGTSAYAFQMADLPDRTVSFGWVCSPYEEFVSDGSASNGCMTIPRETFMKDGKLYTVPAREMKALDGRVLYEGRGESFAVETGDNCYRLDISFSKNTDFRIIFSENEEKLMGVAYDSGRLRILSGRKDGLPAANLFCDAEEIASLTVYVDRSVIEIFVNGGEAVGTKDYFIKTGGQTCRALFRNPSHVEKAVVTGIKSIWR